MKTLQQDKKLKVVLVHS